MSRNNFTTVRKIICIALGITLLLGFSLCAFADGLKNKAASEEAVYELMAPATEGEAIDETTVEIEDEEVPLAGRKNPASAWWMLVMLVLIAGGAYIGTGRTSKRVHMYNR